MTEQLRVDLMRFDVQKNSISSLFIGGGTPSTMSPKLYEPFFKTVLPYLTQDAEITSEANPNSATHTWLSGMKDLGVNRISFGVQSFQEDKLKLLGRNHSSKQAIEAVSTASELGYKHLSLDLIYGTSLDTKKRLLQDIKQATSLPIDHISSYALTLEENTLFEDKPEVQKDSTSLARFFAKSVIEEGFSQYEISNFGTYQCRHNFGYWQHQPYLGIGCGAVGFVGNHRYYPHTNIEAYIKDPFTCKEESLHVKDLHVEKLFLGLRSKVGIKKSELTSSELEKTTLLVKEGKLCLENDIYTNPDYFLADEIALFLME